MYLEKRILINDEFVFKMFIFKTVHCIRLQRVDIVLFNRLYNSIDYIINK